MLEIQMIQSSAKVADTNGKRAEDPADTDRTRDTPGDDFEAEYSAGREQRKDALPSADPERAASKPGRESGDAGAQTPSERSPKSADTEPSTDHLTVQDVSAYEPSQREDEEMVEPSEYVGVTPAAPFANGTTAPGLDKKPEGVDEQLAGPAIKQKLTQASGTEAGQLPVSEEAQTTVSEPQKMLPARNNTAETVIASKAAALSKSEAAQAAPAASTPDAASCEKPANPVQPIAAQRVSMAASPPKHPGQVPSGQDLSKTELRRGLPLQPSPQAASPAAMAPGPKPSLPGAQAVAHVKLAVQKDKVELMPIISGDLEHVTAWETRAGTTNATGSLAQTLARADTPAAIGRQMVEALRKLPDRPVELSLNPRELGRVRMSISAAEAGITVSVVAERPETLDLMRRNIDQLAREFQSIGYENINFSFAEGQSRENRQTDFGFDDRALRSSIELEHAETTAAVPDPIAAITTGLDLRL